MFNLIKKSSSFSFNISIISIDSKKLLITKRSRMSSKKSDY